MEYFVIAYQVVLVICLIVFAYVVTALLKANYSYYSQMLDWVDVKEPLLFKLPSKVVSVLLVMCFLALVL